MHELENHLYHTLTGPIWKKLGVKKRHGINLPLACLHSKNSCGIGEFLDLLPLIDWCHRIKMDVVQLLPLNDSGNDPSPYNALSSKALNPIYLSLYALPHLEELREELPSFKHLNESKKVDYHSVLSHKINFLRKYYTAVKSSILKSHAFSEFYETNSHWIHQYALYKVLKDRLAQNSWSSWPEELKEPTQEQFNALVVEHEEEMLFYIALQYLSFTQLAEVKKHAASKQILIKGDIPILISADSADVWQYKEYFNLDLAAGSPPDHYNHEGQYWGFPLFHWDAIERDRYSWWKERLEIASQFYDLYRIDHVVGFYRLWGIPLERPAKEGRFIPEDPSLWLIQGDPILRMMVAASPMLPIAEDLGIVPKEVRHHLHSLGICGTNVIRWERDYHHHHHFIPPRHYPSLGMTTLSTHDSETLQQWYQDFPDEAKAYASYKQWAYDPILDTEKRKEILFDAHHSHSLFHINLIQEYLALFPELVWPDPADERINVPGKVLPTNWTYRTLPSLEQITQHEGLKETIIKIIDAADVHQI